MATLQESGGDYSNMAAAVAANETVIDISGTWSADDSTASTLTTTVDTTITAIGDSKCPGFAHQGVGSFYRLRKTGAGHAFTLGGTITAIGVDIQNQSTGVSDECFRAPGDSVTLTDCVVGFASRNAEQDIINSPVDTAVAVIITNCMVYNALRSVFNTNAKRGPFSIDLVGCSLMQIGTTNTGRDGIVGSQAGVGDGAVVTVRMLRCFVDLGGTAVAFKTSATALNHTLTIDRCLSTHATLWEDGNWNTVTITDSLLGRTVTDTLSPGAGDWVIVEDATSPFDLRLQDNDDDNDAQSQGTSATGAGLTMPATDIIGTARPQGTEYDAGAFEVVVVLPHDLLSISRLRIA